jgi:hypothetical protein
MATRAEVIKLLRGYNDVEDLEDGDFRVMINLDGGRTQLVFISVHDHVMTFKAAFAGRDDITSSKALDFAGIFGISPVGDFYAMTHTVFLEDLDESEVLSSASWVAMAADNAEKELGGDRF